MRAPRSCAAAPAGKPARVGRPADRRSAQARLESEGLLPEEKYYNALVRGAVAAGRLEDAEAVLQKMHHDVLNLELVSRRGGSLPPSALSYGACCAPRRGFCSASSALGAA